MKKYTTPIHNGKECLAIRLAIATRLSRVYLLSRLFIIKTDRLVYNQLWLDRRKDKSPIEFGFATIISLLRSNAAGEGESSVGG